MLVIIDVEATCQKIKTPDFISEIIEIGAVKFDLSTLEIADEFQAFISPKINPILSDFCKELTNIKQSDVDSAHNYETEYNRFVKWYGNPDKNLFSSWGFYDQAAFRKNCAIHNLEYKLSKDHWNLKKFYEELRGTKKGVGLGRAIKQLGLAFEGEPHRALNDAKNTAYVLREIMRK